MHICSMIEASSLAAITLCQLKLPLFCALLSTHRDVEHIDARIPAEPAVLSGKLGVLVEELRSLNQ